MSEKNELKPWQKKMWCIPPKHNAEFVFHMENVLEVYQRPYDAPSRATLAAAAELPFGKAGER